MLINKIQGKKIDVGKSVGKQKNCVKAENVPVFTQNLAFFREIHPFFVSSFKRIVPLSNDCPQKRSKVYDYKNPTKPKKVSFSMQNLLKNCRKYA